MDFPEWDASVCGLSVRTDSLTVFVDLSRVPEPVARAFRAVLQVPQNPSGKALPYSDGASVTRASRSQFESLSQTNPAHALQFATLLSAFFHEVRHVHDLRATWIGAELLINDYRVYASAEKVIGELSDWQSADSARRVMIPLSKSLDQHSSDNDFPVEPIRSSLTQAGVVSRWWDARSSFRTLPGTSIRQLFEALGFYIQIEWLADTFGTDVANEVSRKALGDEPHGSPYLRPVYLLASYCQAKGSAFDPELHDITMLLFESLNASGLDEAFSNGKATEFHPGAWFDRFAHQYAYVSTRDDVKPEHRANAAIHLALREAEKGDLPARMKQANERLSKLQEQLLKDLMGDSFSTEAAASILLATEIGVDFRDMQRILAQSIAYLTPAGYVDLLMKGELHTVYTRLKEEDGRESDFLTPSHIPTNHVGGIRHASLSSQKMRILLGGRDFRNRSFFEESVFQTLKGSAAGDHGLKFRRID